jgi:hypothetical protein
MHANTKRTILTLFLRTDFDTLPIRYSSFDQVNVRCLCWLLDFLSVTATAAAYMHEFLRLICVHTDYCANIVYTELC